ARRRRRDDLGLAQRPEGQHRDRLEVRRARAALSRLCSRSRRPRLFRRPDTAGAPTPRAPRHRRSPDAAGAGTPPGAPPARALLALCELLRLLLRELLLHGQLGLVVLRLLD